MAREERPGPGIGSVINRDRALNNILRRFSKLIVSVEQSGPAAVSLEASVA
jgi:hypothetical protein